MRRRVGRLEHPAGGHLDIILPHAMFHFDDANNWDYSQHSSSRQLEPVNQCWLGWRLGENFLNQSINQSYSAINYNPPYRPYGTDKVPICTNRELSPRLAWPSFLVRSTVAAGAWSN